MKRRTPTLLLTIFCGLFCFLWFPFLATLFVFTGNSDSEHESPVSVSASDFSEIDEENIPPTYLDVFPSHILLVEVIFLTGVMVYFLLIFKYYLVPRWWLPVVITLLFTIGWFGLISLVGGMAEKSAEIEAVGEPGAGLADLVTYFIFPSAIIFFVMLGLLPKGRLYKPSPPPLLTNDS